MKKPRYIGYMVLFVVVFLVVFGFIYNMKFFVYRSAVAKRSSERISDFKYYDGYEFDGKKFFLTEYQRGESYCYGYHEYSNWGLFYNFSSYHLSSICGGQMDDWVDANHVVRLNQSGGVDGLYLYVFGVNVEKYSDVIITYSWGDQVVVPVSYTDPLFIYYEEINVPDEYQTEIKNETYFEVSYISH